MILKALKLNQLIQIHGNQLIILKLHSIIILCDDIQVVLNKNIFVFVSLA